MKRVVSMLMVMTIVAMFCGCGKNAETSENYETQMGEAGDAAISNAVIPVDVEPENGALVLDDDDLENETLSDEAAEAEVDEYDDDDPYGMYICPQDFIEEMRRTGTTITLLERDGVYYGLGRLPRENALRYGVGALESPAAYPPMSRMYRDCYGNYRVAMGDFPELVLRRGEDKVIQYSTRESGIECYPVEFRGYTFRHNVSYGTCILYDATGEQTTILEDEYKVLDKNGDEIEGSEYDLEYGETYTIQWSKGTLLEEKEMVADARYFWRDRHARAIYLEGEPTKEGYAIIDISELEPGLYWFGFNVVRIE